MHVKGDKVILVHCPEYKSLVNSRKYNGLLVHNIQTLVMISTLFVCFVLHSVPYTEHKQDIDTRLNFPHST